MAARPQIVVLVADHEFLPIREPNRRVGRSYETRADELERISWTTLENVALTTFSWLRRQFLCLDTSLANELDCYGPAANVLNELYQPFLAGQRLPSEFRQDVMNLYISLGCRTIIDTSVARRPSFWGSLSCEAKRRLNG